MPHASNDCILFRRAGGISDVGDWLIIFSVKSSGGFRFCLDYR